MERPLTVGQLARATGVPAKTIRYDGYKSFPGTNSSIRKPSAKTRVVRLDYRGRRQMLLLLPSVHLWWAFLLKSKKYYNAHWLTLVPVIGTLPAIPSGTRMPAAPGSPLRQGQRTDMDITCATSGERLSSSTDAMTQT
jgi:hypothetical protein